MNVLDLLGHNIVRLLALVVLLVCCAFFGGAETALFTLARHQLKSFRTGANPFLRLASRLMERPQATLVTILLGNMTVNVWFYAAASVVVLRASAHLPGWQSAIVGCLPALAIIFFGGVLPKVFAATYPALVATVVAGPLYVFDRIVGPIGWVLQRALVGPGVRLLTPPEKGPRSVGHDELKEILERSAAQGILAPAEGVLLREVVELGTIKVREIAVPRVDMVTFDCMEPREAFLDLVREKEVRRIPAYRDEPDNIIGILYARDVLLKPDDPLEDLLRPAWFVPETQRIDALLRDFQQSGREMAVAVDEYGGVTGVVTLQDVIAEVVGDIFEPGEGPSELVRQVDADTYLVSGRLSIRDWAQAFGQRFASIGVDTIGGLITARLGRLARIGDTLTLRNLLFTVTKVQRNRVVEVRLERLADILRPANEKEKEKEKQKQKEKEKEGKP
jgi:putative hemolysin